MDARTLEKKLKFIDEYKQAENAATGSKYDSNANVTQKNVAVLQNELNKKEVIDVRRGIICKYLEQDFGKDMAENYLNDLKHHLIYANDESSIMPYCCSISMYPFILEGLQKIGGSSTAPHHLDTFCGSFINLIFLVAGQFAGAVATPEFLTYFDHFARIDYGQDYVKHLDDVVEKLNSKEVTLRSKLEHYFAQVIYTINQPAGARGYQSVFWNIAYFDKYYFESIFKDFVFPDGDEPCWETTKELQKIFMKWFNKERTIEILTFPVETANILVEDGKYKDEEMADFFAEMWSEGHSFFMYQSDSVDALASCCFRGDETITVIEKDTGKELTITLKDFCEQHSKDFNKFQTLSYNVEKRKTEMSDITGVLDKVNEQSFLIEIEDEEGKIIRVTPEHILLVKDEKDNLLEIKAKDLVNNFKDYELITNN